MAEQQVTLDGQTHPLPDPFFVIATQNPVDLSGTFPLPDSQLDRFLLRLAMGYPSAQAERELLRGSDRRDLIARAVPKLDDTQVRTLRDAVNQVHASDALIDYVQALLTRSRQHAGVRVGLSPRAGLALLRAARAHALLLGRGHVVPEDADAVRRRGRPPVGGGSRIQFRAGIGTRDPADRRGGLNVATRWARMQLLARPRRPEACRSDWIAIASMCCPPASACSLQSCWQPCCWAR